MSKKLYVGVDPCAEFYPEKIKEDVLFFIRTSDSEYSSSIKGYFKTFEDALEALKKCNNWYCSSNTGTIYQIEYGLKTNAEMIYRAW